MRKSLAVLGACLLFAYPASAIDGVLEINRACVADGCFPGDGPGLPIVLAFAGSYRLTSSIVGAPSLNAIEISVPSAAGTVTLDLNGFELVGAPGSLDGIAVMNSSTAGVTVRNGAVRAFGSDGIWLRNARSALVEGVLAESNGSNGIYLFSGVVRNSSAWGNGGTGISIELGGLVENCVAQQNSGSGIFAYGSSVRGSSAQSNQGDGIRAERSTVTDSSAVANQLAGIRIDEGTVASSNASRNDGSNILVEDASRVVGNSCSGQGSFAVGIDVQGSRNRIEGNNVAQLLTGLRVTGTGNLIVGNSASGNSANYQIGAGNTAGPGVGSATIATDTNPHANYAY